MARFLPCILCLLTTVTAQTYEEVVAEAMRLEREVGPGETAEIPLDRAYRRLADAARLAPARWEAFALRGTNRCAMAVAYRRLWRRRLEEARARGEPAGVLQSKERAGEIFIERCIQNAKQNFGVMHRNMQARGRVDHDRLRFATAALRYAQREYLKARDGGPGAIDGFRSLIKRGWKIEYCSEYIARCYLEMGLASVMADNHEQAHRHWRQGLKWAQEDSTKRSILTSMAAAYDLDNEYGLAEEIIRQQIDKESNRAVHWKHLGLMLGHQNQLRAALDAYGRARALCVAAKSPVFLGYFHGNAWLKAAMIHGKLLEEDGDLLLAWRLFLEYRQMRGDSYSFCVNFGEFAFQMRQYGLAWAFLERGRDLQPFCVMPYHLLLQTALRMEGPREEMDERIRKAREGYQRALKRFRPSEESARLKRICGGLSDRVDDDPRSGPAERLEPDPLEGLGPGVPPDWIVKAAATRKPFRPYDPAIDDQDRRDDGREAPAPAPQETGRAGWIWGLVLAGLLLVGGALFFWRRR